MGVPWLTDRLGVNALLEVSIAWGADLTADSDTWVWTDVSGDVRHDPGVSFSWGKGDEASVSQPAKLSLRLDNRSGAYSLGGESPNWPYVRRNVPVRVRLDPDGSGYLTVFFGFATGFTPVWPAPDAPHVNLEASGPLRRLRQGQGELQSAHTRGTRDLSTAIAYWPMEEGAVTNVFWPLIDDHWLVWTGNQVIAELGIPDLAADSSFVVSRPLPILKGAWLYSLVPDYAPSATFQVTALVQFPRSVEDQATIIGLQTVTGLFIDLAYAPFDDGQLAVFIYDDPAAGVPVASDGPFDFDVHLEPRTIRVHLQLEQVGGDIEVTYGVARSNGTAQAESFTATGFTFGQISHVFVNSTNFFGSAGRLQDTVVGHLVLRTDLTSFFDEIELVTGWLGETATDRIQRLARENDESLLLFNGTESTTTMGPQQVATYLDLLRECEAADGGVLFDGHGGHHGGAEGLTYMPRAERENRPPDLVLDATAGQLKYAFEPIDDDQRTINWAHVTRKGAQTASYRDHTGPMGSEVIGAYETHVTINLGTDEETQALAEWMVHVGTQEGYRYPTVTMNLSDNTELVAAVLDLEPGSRVDIYNLGDALTGHPSSEPLSLLVEGLSHRLTSRSWTVVLQCSLFSPWLITQLGKAASAIEVKGTGTSASAASSTAGTTVTGTLPDFDPGDLLLIFASVRNSGTGSIVVPDGWHEIATSGNFTVLGRIAQEGDAHPAIFASGGAANATLLVQSASFSGVNRDIHDCCVASATQLNGSAQNIAYPALTVPEDNCLVVVAGWKQDDWTSVATLAGMTELFEADTTDGDDAGLVADYVVQTTASNIIAGSLVVTGGAAAISRSMVLAFARDTDPPEMRLDTDGSYLDAAVSVGATSISVRTRPYHPITYVGAGSAGFANNGPAAVTLPTNWQTDDLLLIWAFIRNTAGSVTTPAGWTKLVDMGNSALLGRIAQSAESGFNVTFTGGAAGDTTGAVMFAYRNAHPDLATLLANSSTQSNASAQNIAYPALTVPHQDCLVLALFWKATDYLSSSEISGFTQIVGAASTLGNDSMMVVKHQIQTATTNIPSGTMTITGGVAGVSDAAIVAISAGAGPLWTTDSSDYPLDLDIGGVKFTATACADSTNPQTISISAAPVARDDEDPVKLWLPRVLPR